MRPAGDATDPAGDAGTRDFWEGIEAVLFDLDGVLTDTARLHAACWKRTFDEVLRRVAEERGEPFRPFDAEGDYRRHVDGKRRFDGVRDFLRSRGVELPEGEPDDPPDRPTVCGVGNLKNARVAEALAAGGVEVYPASLALVRALRAAGRRTAVVSSSANCAEVLRAASIDSLFDARVDGAVAAERGLAGKPAPDTFLAAAAALGVPPERGAVVEDAVSGVQAGVAGGFRRVIGVSRHGEPELLRAAGAEPVVGDLGELPLPEASD